LVRRDEPDAGGPAQEAIDSNIEAQCITEPNGLRQQVLRSRHSRASGNPLFPACSRGVCPELVEGTEAGDEKRQPHVCTEIPVRDVDC
jgi:hypothetical protein